MLAVKLAFVLAGMSVIPQGTYSPLYATKGGERLSVRRFALDREPVTRGEFLEFVRRNREWRRSAVKRDRADIGYLADWPGDLSAGRGTDLRRPVTSVSRNAARAYCASEGKRLPTQAEWEYVASASTDKRDAVRDKSFISRLLGFYSRRTGTQIPAIGNSPANVYGVSDLHELVWEWTAEPAAAAHAFHGAHENHMFCASSAIGAVDPSNYPAFLRYAVRSGLKDRTTLRTLGFRCAGSLPA